MRLVLGFDGGGTKTDGVLADASGAILARAQGGPANPSRIGFARALVGVREAAQGALAAAGREPRDVAAVCAGLAGTGQPADAEKMRLLIAAEFPASIVKVCSDLDLAMASAGEGPAIVLIGGTGSAAIGRGRGGEIVRAGGHGPILGDEGSAYDIGRRAALAAVGEHDRRGSDSDLGTRILRELGCATWPEVRLRAQAAADEVFPRIFSVVAGAAENGDESARDILRAAAARLSLLVATLVERLGFQSTAFLLVKSGGIHHRSKFFDSQIDAHLYSVAPQATFGETALPPAEVAARMACGLLPERQGTE